MARQCGPPVASPEWSSLGYLIRRKEERISMYEGNKSIYILLFQQVSSSSSLSS